VTLLSCLVKLTSRFSYYITSITLNKNDCHSFSTQAHPDLTFFTLRSSAFSFSKSFPSITSAHDKTWSTQGFASARVRVSVILLRNNAMTLKQRKNNPLFNNKTAFGYRVSIFSLSIPDSHLYSLQVCHSP
jgi:hypothetical protein